MTVKLINRGETGEFIVEGKLDANTSPEIEKLILGQTDRFEKIVLNLSGLTYISSAGLRVVKILHMTMKKSGGELVITNVNRTVMEVFEMTGFSQLLNFE